MVDEDVTVVVEGDEPPAEPSEDTNVVVVEDTPAPQNTDAVVELATRVGALESWRESMSERVDDVEQTADAAQTTAEFAEDIAVDAVQETPEIAADVAEEVAEETVEEVEDEPPAKVHWTHRSMRDLFGGNR